MTRKPVNEQSTIAARQAAAEALKARRAARQTLAAYQAYMAGTGHPDFKFEHAPHHALVAAALERLARREIRRLMILLPPGSAKSTIGNVQFVTWLLARGPEQVLAISHGETLAETFARRKRLALLEPRWQALAGTALRDDDASLGRFSTVNGGQHVAAGVGSAIAGLRASVGVIDDPISGFEVALSPTQLAKVVDWHDADYRSRLLPDAIELLITTRWARNDLAGVLMDRNEGWHVIRIPMLADSDDDPLGREHGERLWSAWFTEQQVSEAQRDPLRWSCLFQQRPLDEVGTWVGPEHLHYIDEAPSQITNYCAVDLALTVGRGDFTAISIAGIDARRDLIVREVWRRRAAPDDAARALIELCDRYRVVEVLIDDDNASKVFLHVIAETCRSMNHPPLPVHKMPLRGKDKETRATALRALLLADRVKIVKGAYVADLVVEILHFPPGATGHDDQVDSLGLLGRLHAERAGPSARIAPDPKTALERYLDQCGVKVDEHGRQCYGETMGDLFDSQTGGGTPRIP